MFSLHEVGDEYENIRDEVKCVQDVKGWMADKTSRTCDAGGLTWSSRTGSLCLNMKKSKGICDRKFDHSYEKLVRWSERYE